MHYRFEKYTLDEYPNLIPIPGELGDDSYVWWKWRIPFRYAYLFFNDLKHCDPEVVKLYSRHEFLLLVHNHNNLISF